MEAHKEKLSHLFAQITEKVIAIDKSLEKTSLAEEVKAMKSLDHLENKMKKSIKQKEEINLNRAKKLQKGLFPKGLQERHDNILQYIATYGVSLIQDLLPYCDPFDKNFKVFMPQSKSET